MKKLMCMVALATSLLGSASFAMAQPFSDDGVITGSEANRAAHANGGDYGE